MPNNACEGELSDDDSMRTNQHGSAKRNADQMKQSVSDNKPWRTRGIRTDYRYLNDPFPDELEAAQITINNNITPNPIYNHTYAVNNNDCMSLKEAKASSEWPE